MTDTTIQHITERSVGRPNAEAGASKPEAKIVEISLAVVRPNGRGVRPNCNETLMFKRRRTSARHSRDDDAVVREGEGPDVV